MNCSQRESFSAISQPFLCHWPRGRKWYLIAILRNITFSKHNLLYSPSERQDYLPIWTNLFLVSSLGKIKQLLEFWNYRFLDSSLSIFLHIYKNKYLSGISRPIWLILEYMSFSTFLFNKSSSASELR